MQTSIFVFSALLTAAAATADPPPNADVVYNLELPDDVIFERITEDPRYPLSNRFALQLCPTTCYVKPLRQPNGKAILQYRGKPSEDPEVVRAATQGLIDVWSTRPGDFPKPPDKAIPIDGKSISVEAANVVAGYSSTNLNFDNASSRQSPPVAPQQPDSIRVALKVIQASKSASDREYKLDPRFVSCLICSENSCCESDATSNKGAIGLGQVMRGTALFLEEKYFRAEKKTGKERERYLKALETTLKEPEYNLTMSALYLRDLASRDYIDGDPLLMAAAYNAGPDKVLQAGKDYRKWLQSRIASAPNKAKRQEFAELLRKAGEKGRVPRIAETEKYVRDFAARFGPLTATHLDLDQALLPSAMPLGPDKPQKKPAKAASKKKAQ